MDPRRAHSRALANTVLFIALVLLVSFAFPPALLALLFAPARYRRTRRIVAAGETPLERALQVRVRR